MLSKLSNATPVGPPSSSEYGLLLQPPSRLDRYVRTCFVVRCGRAGGASGWLALHQRFRKILKSGPAGFFRLTGIVCSIFNKMNGTYSFMSPRG